MTSTIENTSTFGLMGRLTRETKIFIRQELELAKTELGEKISMMGKNAVGIVVGGFVAYAGVIILLGGLGVLIGFALAQGGMNPFLAEFIGLAIIGIVVAAVGYFFIMKSIKTISKEGIAPKRTIETIQELRGEEAYAQLQAERQREEEREEKEEEQYKPTSEQIQARVEATENRMGETLDELGRRLSPQHINARIKGKLAERPYRAGLIAMGVGVLSGLFITRKFRHA